MRYLSVAEIAKKWNRSERSVRNYCAHGRVQGAFLTGKIWNIPAAWILLCPKKFEPIHPFQDGNGRVGRLIMFKECLKYNIVPFIIEDNLKMFYYRGLKNRRIGTKPYFSSFVPISFQK